MSAQHDSHQPKRYKRVAAGTAIIVNESGINVDTRKATLRKRKAHLEDLVNRQTSAAGEVNNARKLLEDCKAAIQELSGRVQSNVVIKPMKSKVQPKTIPLWMESLGAVVAKQFGGVCVTATNQKYHLIFLDDSSGHEAVARAYVDLHTEIQAMIRSKPVPDQYEYSVGLLGGLAEEVMADVSLPSTSSDESVNTQPVQPENMSTSIVNMTQSFEHDQMMSAARQDVPTINVTRRQDAVDWQGTAFRQGVQDSQLLLI